MIRGSDGLDYEDLFARLAGEPAKTDRNGVLTSKTLSKLFKDTFRDTYDHYEEQGCPPLECCRVAYAQAAITAADATRVRRWADGNDFGVITLRPNAYF